MPDLYGKTYKEAESILDKLKITFEVEGEGDFVYSTLPFAGEKVRVDDIVLIKT